MSNNVHSLVLNGDKSNSFKIFLFHLFSLPYTLLSNFTLLFYLNSPKRDREGWRDEEGGRRGDGGANFDHGGRKGSSEAGTRYRRDQPYHSGNNRHSSSNGASSYDHDGGRDVKRRKEFEQDSSSHFHSSSSSNGRNNNAHPSYGSQYTHQGASLAKRVLPEAQTALGNSDAFSQPSMPVLDDETYRKRIEAEMEAKKKAESQEDEIEKRRRRLRELLEKEEALKRQQASVTTSAAVKMDVVQPEVPKEVKVSQEKGVVTHTIDRKMGSNVVAPVNPLAMVMKEVDPDDDMFGDSFVDKVKEESGKGVNKGESKSGVTGLGGLGVQGSTVATDATCDDDEGYYNFRVGEVLGGGKYEVLGYYGKGVYSNVIKAKRLVVDRKDGDKLSADASSGDNPPSASSSGSSSSSEIVAIKLLRNNAHMKRSGRKEVKILKKLEEMDEGGKCHCLRLEEVFEEKRHLCLVFPAYDLNLTQVIKLYGHHVGIHIRAVRSYAFKLIKALALLKRCSIIHADIKPDNILVSQDRAEVILADFGTALELQEVEMTNQMVSRFYRAPEIILGFASSISFPIDMWSIGCCLYEMATGKYLMPSRSENEHIRMSFEIGGPFPKKLLSSAHPPYLAPHFIDSSTGNGGHGGSGAAATGVDSFLFLEHYPDPLNPTSNFLVRKVPIPVKPTRLILPELLSSFSSSSLSPTELAWVHRLADLITQCLILDPKKRITPEDALQHSFF